MVRASLHNVYVNSEYSFTIATSVNWRFAGVVVSELIHDAIVLGSESRKCHQCYLSSSIHKVDLVNVALKSVTKKQTNKQTKIKCKEGFVSGGWHLMLTILIWVLDRSNA